MQNIANPFTSEKSKDSRLMKSKLKKKQELKKKKKP